MNAKTDMDTFQDKLKTIEKSDVYPFHMPGHKRAVINADLQNPYLRDITEIDGFDNLHCPTGFISEEEKFAAELFGADNSFYLVNGSSCGILAAMMTVSARDGKFLLARNAHKSVFHGLYLSGKDADYLYPVWEKKANFSGAVSVSDIREKLEKEAYAAILITSPTYEGIVSDVKGICEAAHAKGIPVIVDEAHGAHLGIFGGGFFPESAVRCGADLVIQSTHKTLPSMTQTALLHVQGDLIDTEKLKYFLSVFQSSSPSYILMESISDSLHYCREHKEDLLSDYTRRLTDFYEKTAELKNLRVYQPEAESTTGRQIKDPGKLVICIREDVDFTGKQFYDLLRETYRLQLEMAERDYVIAMTSVMDTDEGFQRLIRALYEIDGMLEKKSGIKKNSERIRPETESVLSVRQAMDAEKKLFAVADAVGKCCGEFLYLYPPGIPVLIPGERITKELISYLETKTEAGFLIQGSEQFDKGMIACVS